MDEVVLFEELRTAGDRRFGVATLNAPATLNALSLAMVQRLTPQLHAWAADPKVAGVLLQASGEKAFCAGGDLRELYGSMRSCGAGPNAYASGFFAQEYQLDHLIHTFPKPVLCWGGGIVMGGGIGLMAGASHRVVTSTSRLAMPEVSIGLYPDVGGSWFLRRMPGRVGLFLALTAAPLNAADALFCGMADFHLDAAGRGALLDAVATHTWSEPAAANRTDLSRLLARLSVDALKPSKVREHFDAINMLMAGDDLLDIANRLRDLRSDDPWLANAAATFVKGSPTSAALAFRLWQRVPRMSLVEVFRLEYRASLGCCAHPDFAEGIRALLIDKDRHPQWDPAHLEEVTPALVEDHFAPRGVGPDPLADLT